MIVLVVHYQAQAGQGDVVAEALGRAAAKVRETEPGCAAYQASRAQDNPDHFVLYEQYVDEAALAQHREMPAYLEIVQKEIAPLLEKRERRLYTLVAG